MSFASATAARLIGRFTGRLQSVTLTRPADSAIDFDDPTAAPTGNGTDYAGDGYAFTYEQRDVDGTRVLKGDYRVVILRSLAVIPRPGDSVLIPPPGETVARSGRVINVESVTESFTTVQVRGS